MRGHVRRRGKKWAAVVSLGRDDGGRYRYQWYSGYQTEREAQAKLTQVLREMDTGAYVEPTRETVGTFLDRWLCDYAKTNVSPRTYEGYEHIIVRHLIPALGAIQLTKLAPAQIQRYYANKLASGRLNGKGGLSPRTVHHHHVTLHDALQSGVKWGLLGRNPADAVDAPKFERGEMKTLDDEGVRGFLAAVRETQWYPMAYLALFTGLRRSEVLALRWGDVDLDLARVYVNRAVHRLRTGEIIFRTTKSAKSRRVVALPPSAALMLREHRDAELRRRELVDGATLDDQQLVFARIDGSPIPPDSFSQAWSRLASRHGFRGVRLHDARHTHATLLLKQDVHPKIVQERLGHSTIATTLDIYSHVVPGLQDAAAQAFDRVLEGSPAKVL